MDHVSTIIYAPIGHRSPVSEQLYHLVQRLILSTGVVPNFVGCLRVIISAQDAFQGKASSQQLESPARLLSRLVLGQPGFGNQFVEAGGLRDGILQRLLARSNPARLLVETLLMLSQLARTSKDHCRLPQARVSAEH